MTTADTPGSGRAAAAALTAELVVRVFAIGRPGAVAIEVVQTRGEPLAPEVAARTLRAGAETLPGQAPDRPARLPAGGTWIE